MSLSNFIPQVWAGTMVRYLDKTQIFAQAGVVNRDYEGEISGAGDTVKISQVGPVTIGTYTKNTSIGTPETLDSAQTALVIDQQDYFNFMVDDVDQAQQRPKVMETAMQRAAYGMSDTVDTFLAELLATSVPSGNQLSADTSPAVADGDFFDHLVDLAAKLSLANVPTMGRWVIINPLYTAGLIKEQPRFANMPVAEGWINGQIAEVAGMRILESNNVYTAGSNVYTIVAGSDMACSFASQIVSVEAFRPEGYFSDAVKGLQVYGAKVVLPNALASIDVTLT